MAKITANPSAGTLELELNGVAQLYKTNPGVDLDELYSTLEQMGQYFPANVIPYLRANATLQGAQPDPSSAALEPAGEPDAAPSSGSPQSLPTFVPPEGEGPPPGVPGGPSEAVAGGISMGTGPEQTIDGIPLSPDLPQDAEWPEGGIQGDERPVYTGSEMGYMEDYETWRKSFPDGIVYSKVDGGVEQALLDGRLIGAWDPATSSGTVFELTSAALGFTPATASSAAVPGETEQEWQRELAPHQPDQRPTKESNMKRYAVIDRATRRPVGGPFGTQSEAQQAWVFEHDFAESLEIGIVIGDPTTGQVQTISVGSVDCNEPDVQLPASLVPTGESSFDDTTSRDDWQNSQDDNDAAANIAKTKVGDADVYTSMDDDGNPLSTYIDGGDGKGREIGKTESGPRCWTIARPPATASKALCEAATKRERVLVQYADSGNQLSTVRRTRPTLEAGVYQIKESMAGIYFEKIDVNSDELLQFEDERLNAIHEEINRFWGLADVFQEMGLTHKRGVLMFGQPGMGKSCLIKQVTEAAVAQDTVVFMGMRNMGLVVTGLREFKEVEPERRALVVMEDMDEVCSYNEHAVLELMDGGDQMNGVLVLGTTNYPERLPPRVMRSGRFDTKVEVKSLPLAGRLAYFTHKLAKKEGAERIREIAGATDGMSFAQMRELIASVYCYGRSFEASVQRILRNLTEGKASNRWTEQRLDALLEQAAKTGVKSAGLRMLTESTEQTQEPVTICGYEQWKSQIAAANPGATFEQDGKTTTACVDGRVIGTYLGDLDSGVMEAEVQPDPTAGTVGNPGSATAPQAPADLKSADDEELQVAFFGKPVAEILSSLSGEYSVDDILSLATRSDFETLEPVTRAMIMTAFDFFSTQQESLQREANQDGSHGWQPYTDNKAFIRDLQAKFGADVQSQVVAPQLTQYQLAGARRIPVAWWDDMHGRGAINTSIWTPSDSARRESKITRDQLDRLWEKYDQLDRACNEEFGDQAPASRRAQVTRAFNEFAKACQYMGLNPAREVRERTKSAAAPTTIVKTEQRGSKRRPKARRR